MSDIQIKRHDLAHILASAVLKYYPEIQIKLGIGPDIENGFYYDFELSEKISEEDLPKIEKIMKKIISQSQKFEKIILPIDEGIKKLEKSGQIYKKELAEDLKIKGETEISFYQNDDFIDMCKGPHLEHTNKTTKHFKLTKLAGAYFKGDSSRPMLQRVYGVAFETKEELDQYNYMIKEAKKRDHKVLGKKMDLFTITPETGLGLPLWKPKGAMILTLLKRWIEDEQIKRSYTPVITPHIGRKTLWETSGHWGFYNESMYPPLELGQTLADYQDKRTPKETEIYLLKPMNCPLHMQIFADNKYSYRDFPQKYYEFGTVYRYEQKGELNGLLRVRGFTQDDAHIFCTKEQLKTEISNVIDLAFYVLKEKFGFEIELKLSLRDKTKPKYLGKDELWNTAEQALQETLNEKKLNYETEKGEAAFYGPKVDFKVRDALGRLWQLSTVQFDFNLPERFDLKYTDENGEEIRPYVIHRALFGSLERFMGVLIEHFAGAFPFYFAPVQINLLPVADCHKTYAKEIFNKLKSLGIRTEILDSKLTLGKRIRNAEMNKIPYMVILGDQEEKNKTVNIRTYADKEQSEITLTEFINLVVSKNKF